jgi:hypothetical protein
MKEKPLTLTFQDGEKEWILEGHPTYGLPTAMDVTVYVALMQLTWEQGLPEQIQFTRHEILQRLGWSAKGRNYERFKLSLDRLKGLNIRTKNAFYDRKQRKWEKERSLGLIADYELNDSRQVREDELALFKSWVMWSPFLYSSIKAGYIKALDVDVFLSLQSAISQSLYRYLDSRKYDGKPVYRIGIKKLAFEHLGLDRSYAPSQIKRQLDRAHEELVQIGFLGAAEYTKMKTGEEMVVYRFSPEGTGEGTEPEREEVPAGSVAGTLPAPSAPDLVERLISQGVSRASAHELAEGQPEECERQLEYLPHRRAREAGAVLVSAIREGWAAPLAWTTHQEQTQAAEQLRQRAQEQLQARQSKADRLAAEERAFQARWDALEPEQRDALTAEALQLLRVENKVLADLAKRRPDSAAVQEALREIQKRLLG